MTIDHHDNLTTPYTTDTTVSGDGTEIGWRTLGTGPGVVLLHGSNQSAADHMALAGHLADAFTVHLPDRRGRGMTGPYPDDYSMDDEVADLVAVLEATGARRVYGISASGLVALEAGRRMPDHIDRIAVYEPALLLADTPIDMGWIARFDSEMAAGRVSAALVTSMIGLRLGPPVLNVMPRRLLAFLTDKMLDAQDRNRVPGVPTMRELAPTIRYEGLLLHEMRGSLDTFANLRVPVLLMAGSKGLPWLRNSTEALERTLPDVRRVDFPGLDHGGPADVSKANPKARPDLVAAELREFFAD